MEPVSNGVAIVDSLESNDYGKFVHIPDNEGNKIELWEPVDTEYDKTVMPESNEPKHENENNITQKSESDATDVFTQ